MKPLESARQWAREWERAWREHDVDAVGALYADGASFYSHPFREAQSPAAYAAWAFQSEIPGADVHFAEPLVASDGRAVVEWRAVSRARVDASESSLAGVSLLRFDERGLVIDQRDYWSETRGALEPFAG